MREKTQISVEEGIQVLLSLGRVIQQGGKEDAGNILIQPIDYQTCCFIQVLLEDMGVCKMKLPYSFLYDDAYYLQENGVLHKSDFDQYVIGMIIKKKQIERR